MYNGPTNTLPAFFKSGKRFSVSRPRGFTLIELLVVLAIVAVLLMVATPNYDSVMNNSRVDTARMELATSLALARSEAVKRGSTMRVCRGSEGTADSCIADIDDSGDDEWSAGWRVVDVEGAQVLSRTDGVSAQVQVMYDCGKFMDYSSGGARVSGDLGECVFTIGIDGDASANKLLGIVRSGRVRL